jgi:hypothetical protein
MFRSTALRMPHSLPSPCAAVSAAAAAESASPAGASGAVDDIPEEAEDEAVAVAEEADAVDVDMSAMSAIHLLHYRKLTLARRMTGGKPNNKLDFTAALTIARAASTRATAASPSSSSNRKSKRTRREASTQPRACVSSSTIVHAPITNHSILSSSLNSLRHS